MEERRPLAVTLLMVVGGLIFLCVISWTVIKVYKFGNQKTKQPRTLEQFYSDNRMKFPEEEPIKTFRNNSFPLKARVFAPNAGDRCLPGSAISCGSNVGACSPGIRTCGADSKWGGECLHAVLPTAEICDGLDNDCNGVVDDGIGCQCVPGSTRVCGSNIGECRFGQQTCTDQGIWGSVCIGSVGPSFEICGDGLDNDCNGVVDDNCSSTPAKPFALPDGPCLPGSIRFCGETPGKSITQTCTYAYYWEKPCNGPIYN